jgi:predicted Zn finger-like uncharacterized protein
MILTCPQCATGYHADEAKFPSAGQTVRCRKCRHSWHQRKPEPESEQVLELTIQTVPDIDWVDPFDGELILPPAPPTTWAQRLSGAQVAAQTNSPQFKSLVAFAGWGALIAAGLLAALSIEHFGADISTSLPRLSSFQFLTSRNTEIHGVNLRNVGYHREPVNGQIMLVLTGAISNNADRTLRVPKTIIITLSDEDYHELFHTVISAGTATLGAGESVSFRIPIRDVPSANPHLQMDLQN